MIERKSFAELSQMHAVLQSRNNDGLSRVTSRFRRYLANKFKPTANAAALLHELTDWLRTESKMVDCTKSCVWTSPLVKTYFRQPWRVTLSRLTESDLDN